MLIIPMQKPNRFAKQVVNVTLDDDAQVFTSADAVNKALRAILSAIPNHAPI